MGLAELLAPMASGPGRTGLFFDFDGTLAAIVDDPGASRPLPGAAERLAQLAARVERVGVISGRPASFLARHLPGGLALSGLYGLEEIRGGAVVEHPEAAMWRDRVAEAVALARAADLDGALVEPKGLSLTLHHRTSPEAAGAVAEVAARIVAATGLEARTAKASVELHPPIDTDKGRVLSALVADSGVDHVLYVGDDLGDLPAFAAVAQMASWCPVAVSVAVRGPESPPAVLEATDAVVSGPAGVLALLDHLVDLVS